MESPRTGILILAGVALVTLAGGLLGVSLRQAATGPGGDSVVSTRLASNELLRATYDPIHFRPAIDLATDTQCLACHREILDDRVREASPAGVAAAGSRAAYQQLSTYQGEQDTFHRRHLVTPLARELMDLRCNTCHHGHDPRDEAPGSSASAASPASRDFTLRKSVNVEATCLKCHGQMNEALMGLPSPWPQSKAQYGENCLTCHASVRTHRHQVNYLKASAIEAAGTRNADVCYGCHGGRAWYRTSYPYARHAWPGMPSDVPDWANTRPTESELRYRLLVNHPNPGASDELR